MIHVLVQDNRVSEYIYFKTPVLGEQATNHRATINEPLSLPVKLINCLLPTVLFPTWGNKMDALPTQRLKNTEVNQKCRECLETQSEDMCWRRLLGDWEGAGRKDLMLSDLRFS